MNITKKSLKRPVTTLMIFICFIIIGMIASRLIPLEYFPDIDLPALYQGARAMIFLSSYEGFGFTPLEAMAAGTPVIAANTTASPNL